MQLMVKFHKILEVFFTNVEKYVLNIKITMKTLQVIIDSIFSF
jgi:hypothetical protein